MNKSLVDLLYPEKGQQKNIFFSGKGGVGKTSIACVTAVHTAQKGFKTLLLTTDPAAHIGNVLGENVGDEITKINNIENLFGVKIDPKKTAQEYKNKILKEAQNKFDTNTIKAMQEELDSPCTEEMASFQKFINYASLNEFDVIVVDTAPTGHTLRLLELPMDWSKQIQLKTGIQTEISAEDKKEKEKFDAVIEMMKDSAKTTFSFVMYPERTPIIEAHRASQELLSLGIETQLVIANLIIPQEQAQTPFFKNRRNMQVKYLAEINTMFPEALVVESPMLAQEIKGLELLKEMGQLLFE
ncbi:MAG: arsenic ABC transporter ATPase [Peptococcaceae bacterium BICA1-8]|nr:MAG: arsenic ABC transporter ATPase [Peptococcaceae bacterium BICA1-8]